MLERRIEIITGRDRRRRWSIADKLRIVAEAEEPGACFAHVADRNEVSRGLLWDWRAQVRRGTLRPEPPTSFLPVRWAEAAPFAKSRLAEPIQPTPPAQNLTSPHRVVRCKCQWSTRLRCLALVVQIQR